MSSLTNIAFRKFKKDKLGLFGFSIIAVTFLVSLFGVSFFPDSSPNANQMNIELATLSPGSTVKIMLVPNLEKSSSFFL